MEVAIPRIGEGSKWITKATLPRSCGARRRLGRDLPVPCAEPRAASAGGLLQKGQGPCTCRGYRHNRLPVRSKSTEILSLATADGAAFRTSHFLSAASSVQRFAYEARTSAPLRSWSLNRTTCIDERSLPIRDLASSGALRPDMRVPALIRCRRRDLVRNIVPCLALPATPWHRPEVPS
jgi:hypothetical protein